MSLADAVFESITGRPRELRTQSLPETMAYLRRRAGGAQAASRAVGVHYATWKRWATGSVPRPATLAKLISAERGYRLAPGREDEIRADGIILTGSRLDRHYSTRNIRAAEGSGAGLHLAPGTIDAMLAAFKAGDDQGAAAAMLAGTQEAFYRAYLDESTDTGTDDGDDYFGTVF